MHPPLHYCTRLVLSPYTSCSLHQQRAKIAAASEGGGASGCARCCGRCGACLIICICSFRDEEQKPSAGWPGWRWCRERRRQYLHHQTQRAIIISLRASARRFPPHLKLISQRRLSAWHLPTPLPLPSCSLACFSLSTLRRW